MPDKSEITRRWNGYICPDCRFVFRVPRDHDGVGLVCPACRRLLRIPGPADVIPPLVTASANLTPANPVEESTEVEAPPTEMRRRRRRAARDKEGSSPAWERVFRPGNQGSERLVTILMVCGGLLLLIGVLVMIARTGSNSGPQAGPEPSQPFIAPHPDEALTKAADESIPDVAGFLRQAEPMAKSFLNASTVPEVLASVRHPKVTESRLRTLHPEGKLDPPRLESFADDGAVSIEGKTAVVKVRTGSFDQRDLSFYRTEEGWKIDWESWVGWSDMPWAEFSEKQPTTPCRFRVRIKPIIYYNFSFSDDRKWRSYLIESPDGKHQLFGYVERGSRVDNLINLADNPEGGDFLLELSFPSDPSGRNQVLITDRIANSWIEPEPADTP